MQNTAEITFTENNETTPLLPPVRKKDSINSRSNSPANEEEDQSVEIRVEEREPDNNNTDDIDFESDELKSVFDEMLAELKAHFTEINPVLFFVAAAFGLVGLTTWKCNYEDAVPQLAEHFKDAYNIEIDSILLASTIEILRVSAGIGGAGGNLVLNYFGTRGLKARWNTIKDAYTGGSNGYLACYVVIAISAAIAATSSGFVVAEAATTLPEQLLKFSLNFGAALGAHMLFAIPFVGLLDRSPVGDIAKVMVRKTGEALHILKEKTIACLLTEKEYQAVLETREPTDNNARVHLPSAVFNINRRIIIRAGYALASLEDDQKNLISKIKQQIIITTNILSDLAPNSEIAVVDNPFKNYPKRSINNLTPNGEIKYLLELSVFISKLTLDQQAFFFLRAAKKLNVQPESDLEGRFLTLVNTFSLPLSVISCLANLTGINHAFGDVASLATSNPKAIEEVGLSFAIVAAPSKDAMYWNSALNFIERFFFLRQSLKWLSQSSKLVKILIPTTGMLSFYLGLTSGACYALDFFNSFNDILGGSLQEFCALFGVEGALIATTIFVSIGWVWGAGMVNANALATAVVDLVLSAIHIFQPEQKANDALCKQAIIIAAKMIGNLVPDSIVGKELEKVMLAEYQVTLQEQKLMKQEAAERTYNSKESCGRWALRVATFGFCDNRKSRPANNYQEINGDTTSLPNMANYQKPNNSVRFIQESNPDIRHEPYVPSTSELSFNSI